MKLEPGDTSKKLLAMSRAEAKMYEYNIPEKERSLVKIDNKEIRKLFFITISLLGDYSVKYYNQEVNIKELKSLKSNLVFSALFFDSYFNANPKIDKAYFVLLGSAAFYLCDYTGSSKVLAGLLKTKDLNLDANKLEILLLGFLKDDFTITTFENSPYGLYIKKLIENWKTFTSTGEGGDKIFDSLGEIRKEAHKNRSDRDFFFVDVLSAVIKKKYKCSIWRLIPSYSALEIKKWKTVLTRPTFNIRELWPAQILIGEKDVYKGKSATIQMPTSSGKTKATELIIRSAFLSGRTNLAVIVAPFRALCHDIKSDLSKSFLYDDIEINGLTDVYQTDYEFDRKSKKNRVIVLTPEKLLYIMRQSTELAQSIGLIIYDEGHQFDNNNRGANYELLLTSLKQELPNTCQSVFISAVVKNITAINKWLNGSNGVPISGSNIVSTYRSTAFTSWENSNKSGKLIFVDEHYPDRNDFFVPKVIQPQSIKNKNGEQIASFPNIEKPSEISLYLGLKLVNQGSLALFCGKRDSVRVLCKLGASLAKQGTITFKNLLDISNGREIFKIADLYKQNLGDCSYTDAAKLGVLSHHGSLPHGIRVVVEHSLKSSQAKFVICTSTLAQGVNLPLRYLIIRDIRPGKYEMSIRDFQNLIGRAGRAGMYTEGSIIFANNNIYDKRKSGNIYEWDNVKMYLDPEKIEDCRSAILDFLEPSSNKDPFELVMDYINAKPYDKKSKNKIKILKGIEGHILKYVNHQDHINEQLHKLASNTLAYELGNSTQKKQLVKLFQILGKYAFSKTSNQNQRKCFAKTLYGVNENLELEKWVQENFDRLLGIQNTTQFLELVFDKLMQYIDSDSYIQCNKPEKFKSVIKLWLNTESYASILKYLSKEQLYRKKGNKKFSYGIDDVVNICDKDLALGGSLFIGALSEIIQNNAENRAVSSHIKKLELLQKRFRYGLSSKKQILLYELGFCDRTLVQELVQYLPSQLDLEEIKKFLSGDTCRHIFEKYPGYFTEKLHSILSDSQ